MKRELSNPEFKLDLSSCDKEPIHIPGRIQSHGFLLAIEKNKNVITHVSDNLFAFTGIEAKDVLQKNLGQFLSSAGIFAINADLQQIIQYGLGNAPETFNPIIVQCGTKTYNLIATDHAGHILLDFEPSEADIAHEFQQMISMSLTRILDARTLQHTLEYASKEIKQLFNYDRVMIYKFHQDGHGEVVAEERNDDLEPFFGLHYPASDIPKQARDLYKINLIRLIADVNSATADLLTTAEANEHPLDLTHSTLRAVSPIHIQYLVNMKVQSSCSISIIVNDELWGLIACHSYTPKFIDYRARNNGKLIGRILSSAIEYRQDIERKNITEQYQVIVDQIAKSLRGSDNIPAVLSEESAKIMSLTKAVGIALIFEDEILLEGNTPSKEQVKTLNAWLRQNNKAPIFHTNKLPAIFSGAQTFKDKASGMMACMISWEMNEYIMWFKPEIIKTLKWAGDPNKPAEQDATGNAKISPRRSFDEWLENVVNESEAWSSYEISSVMRLREEVITTLNEQANQIRYLNNELRKAYEELDTFSYTISHDLKTPLASIRNYTELLQESLPSVNDHEKNLINKVISNTQKMNILINEVLAYTRLGSEEIQRSELDMKDILQQCINETLSANDGNEVKILIEGTPQLMGDKTMISQVFMNLVGNAVKYSSKIAKPVVRINGIKKDKEVLYTIQDNGIGIDMKFANDVFGLFKRLGNASSFQGTGVGLSIVKRIVEKHKAKIWFESELNKGTTFYLAFSQ